MTDSLSKSTDPRAVPSGVTVMGRLRPPASKSLTQRFYNLALIASGRTVVHLPLRSDDCAHFLAGLEAVGCRVEDRGTSVVIDPPAQSGEGQVFCGASGTMMRFLTATLSTVPGRWRLDGVPRLRQRPQQALLAALDGLGGRIRPLDRPDYLPLEIAGAPLVGGCVRIAARESSQFVSALLMAGTASVQGVELEVEELVSRPYVGLTIDALSRFGVEIQRPREGVFKVASQRPKGSTVTVEPDLSAACYPAAAAALTGGQVVLEGVERASMQGDVEFFDLLGEMGAIIDWQRGRVSVSSQGRLKGVDIDMSDMPDQVPTLAAMAPFAAGTTRIRNVAHLRAKESDRLSAMTLELRRLGAAVEESDDGLSIEGSWADDLPPSSSVVVASHDDHRIAMSCAIVGLRRAGVQVAQPDVVSKSYPNFWEDLAELSA